MENVEGQAAPLLFAIYHFPFVIDHFRFAAGLKARELRSVREVPEICPPAALPLLRSPGLREPPRRPGFVNYQEPEGPVFPEGPISFTPAGASAAPEAWIPWLARNSARAACSRALRSPSFSCRTSMSTRSLATRAFPADCSYRFARISSTDFKESPRSPILNATL